MARVANASCPAISVASHARPPPWSASEPRYTVGIQEEEERQQAPLPNGRRPRDAEGQERRQHEWGEEGSLDRGLDEIARVQIGDQQHRHRRREHQGSERDDVHERRIAQPWSSGSTQRRTISPTKRPSEVATAAAFLDFSSPVLFTRAQTEDDDEPV